MLFLAQEARVFEHTQMPRGGGPLVLEASGDLARGRNAPAKVNGKQNLTARRVRERRDHLVECFELFVRFQAGSTSQMVSSSSTGPIGSQTAMTSGVWCATSDARPSFHWKYSM